jgi:repressor LexA
MVNVRPHLYPMSLTPHQRTTLNYIREFQRKRGYSPSLSDLAVAFGVRSKNAIAKVVNALVREKHLEKAFSLPLFGPIPAGFAAAAEEQAEELLTIEDYLVRDRNATFLLRVKGESMLGAGINDGDLVVVERGKEPRVNDIVVGVLDGVYTLKRLRRDKGKFYLQAENPDYPDLYAMDELQVAGVVRGVIRKY